jgi:hypothetical protein
MQLYELLGRKSHCRRNSSVPSKRHVGRFVGAEGYRRFSVHNNENSGKMADFDIPIGIVDTILLTLDPTHVLKTACFLLLYSCGVFY